MTDLEKRISDLIGEGPRFASAEPTDIFNTWSAWRNAFVQRLAASARVVHTSYKTNWTESKYEEDRYSAILLDLQPINQKVKVSEIVALLRWPSLNDVDDCAKHLAYRIEKEGVCDD